MFIQPFYVQGLAHLSYLLAGKTTCAIIDPRRDVDIYVEAARDLGCRITHVLQTHLHADFVSGHMDLAARTGAAIVVPRAGRAAFPHTPVAGGDRFDLESLDIRVLDTPGHTPEHIAYVVADRQRSPEPAAVFSGDTLFVGDVGRPDLFPTLAQRLANQLYDSLHETLLRLPDACLVFPAHGAGSLCGRAMGAMRVTTIGYERAANAALQIRDRAAFVRSLTTGMPAAPDHFSRCSAINAQGPARVDRLPALAALAPAALESRRRAGAQVLDVRGVGDYGGGHIPHATHIDLGGNFATFAGWILPPDRDLLLVAPDAAAAQTAAGLLRRVGVDRVVGFLEGGMFEWAKAGLPLATIPQLSAPALHEAVSGRTPLQLVDVRSPREFEAHHIEGAVNLPVATLREEPKVLKPEMPTALVCSTGHRSSLGASLLEQRGFRSLMNVAGGMTGYAASGFAPACPVCVVPHGPRTLG